MTYCIAIESVLPVSKCPLEKGQCYWQHRESHKCCYTDADLTTDEFASMVATASVTEDQVTAFRTQLHKAL